MILQKQGLAVDERRKLYQAGMLDEELVFSRIKFLRRKGEIREYMTKRERERERGYCLLVYTSPVISMKEIPFFLIASTEGGEALGTPIRECHYNSEKFIQKWT